MMAEEEAAQGRMMAEEEVVRVRKRAAGVVR